MELDSVMFVVAAFDIAMLICMGIELHDWLKKKRTKKIQCELAEEIKDLGTTFLIPKDMLEIPTIKDLINKCLSQRTEIERLKREIEELKK